MKIEIKFYTMKHRGSLDDALKTKKEISENNFKVLFKRYDFHFYCFDSRINCIRFLISDMCKFVMVPSWLLIEVIYE